MAQFDLHKNLSNGKEFPLLLNLQSDLLADLPTRLVVPLALDDGKSYQLTRLHLRISHGGKHYRALVNEAAAVPKKLLGKAVGSAKQQDFEIIGALDFLLTGV